MSRKENQHFRVLMTGVKMIDPATGWFKIKELPGTKSADVTTKAVEQA
jgi:hypothetical protein